MSYQVLARKYRPQTFHDVSGQDSVVQTLMRALSTGRIAHAFLFTGSRGVGKTTLARILARCLTCEKGPTGTPCGACRMCTSIQAGQAVDVVEIDGASNNGVEQVRDLQEMARFLPQMARFKIFIIDEVHMLSSGAFNALLKTLEEPPPHLKFIFATTEPHKIPVTILSRCQRYDFRRIPSKTIVQRLETVLQAEKLVIDKQGLEVIARAAEGGMRDALSLTDQVLSFAGAAEGVAVTAAQVEEALGLIDRRTIAAAVDSVVVGDAKGALTVVESAFLKGFDLKQLLSLIAEELRHISVSQATGTIKGFADLADDDVQRLDDRAKALDPRDALRLLGMGLEGIDVVANAEDARLALELVLLKMCRRPPIGDALLISEALVRLEKLSKGLPVPPLVERAAPQQQTPVAIATQAFRPVSFTPVTPPPPPTTTTTTQQAAPAPAPPAPAPSAPAPNAVINADGEDEPVVADVKEAAAAKAPEDVEGADEDVAPAPAPAPSSAAAAVVEEEEDVDADPLAGFELPGIDPRWRSFASDVERFAVGMSKGSFIAGRLKSVDGGVITVCFDQQAHAEMATSALKDARVHEALKKAFGDKASLDVKKEPCSTPTLDEARKKLMAEQQQKLEEHAKAHPIVQKALSLFGGEVRTVRRT